MIYVFLAKGFEEIEALTPLDMLRRAKASVETVSVENTREVTGSHDITVIADKLASEINPEDCECIILPGGMPGTMGLDGSAFVDAALKQVWKQGGRLAAICAAPLVLGRRGYLEGKEAICFPGYEEELYGAKISDKVVVTDGRITTGKGMKWSLEFAEELVRILC